jgi:hypothetical protein
MPKRATIIDAWITKPDGTVIELVKTMRPAALLTALHDHNGELKIEYLTTSAASSVRKTLLLNDDIKRVFDISTEKSILIARKYN